MSFTAGGIAALAAVVVLGAAGLVLWADSKKNDDGYATTATHAYASGGYAIATDDLDIDEDGPGDLLGDDLYGHVRLKVDSRSERPVFVGVARTADVERYLGARAGTRCSPTCRLRPVQRRLPHVTTAPRRPALPARPGLLGRLRARVPAPQTLTWKVRSGGLVDRRDERRRLAGVDAGVSVGADIPVLTPLGWGLAGGGLLLAPDRRRPGGRRRPRAEPTRTSVRPRPRRRDELGVALVGSASPSRARSPAPCRTRRGARSASRRRVSSSCTHVPGLVEQRRGPRPRRPRRPAGSCPR